MFEDVCKFIPQDNASENLNTIHFVCETAPVKVVTSPKAYRMNLAVSGDGVLKIGEKIYNLKKGDVFFTFPNTSFSVESVDDFRYIYITYIGIKTIEIMRKLKIDKENFIFHGFDFLIDTWFYGVSSKDSITPIISESLLLYTFSAIGNEIADDGKEKTKAINTVKALTSYVDKNFNNPDISLEKMSTELFYSKKYISQIFKSEMNISFSEYLNTIRIQHACKLLEDGVASVKEVAIACGFHDPLYFSKVFKEHLSWPPSEHLEKSQKLK